MVKEIKVEKSLFDSALKKMIDAPPVPRAKLVGKPRRKRKKDAKSK